MASIDLNECLRLINKARHAQGLPSLPGFPKGAKGEADSCPIANGINAFSKVGSSTVSFKTEEQAKAVASVWRTTLNGTTVALPTSLSQFVRHFDAGNTPSLYGGVGEFVDISA